MGVDRLAVEPWRSVLNDMCRRLLCSQWMGIIIAEVLLGRLAQFRVLGGLEAVFLQPLQGGPEAVDLVETLLQVDSVPDFQRFQCEVRGVAVGCGRGAARSRAGVRPATPAALCSCVRLNNAAVRQRICVPDQHEVATVLPQHRKGRVC